MIIRAKVMDPPLKEKQFMDVRAVHGKRAHTTYISGTGLPDDPADQVGAWILSGCTSPTPGVIGYWN
jgi:hypothetical protein